MPLGLAFVWFYATTEKLSSVSHRPLTKKSRILLPGP